MQKKILRRKLLQETKVNFGDIHPLLYRLYATRKVQSAAELEHDFAYLLPYNFLLGIDNAVAILAETIREQKKILIVGDFDADGATSTAVAIRALRAMGAEQVHFLVPNRFAFGYGLTPELVETAALEFNPALIVTVDNGITNHAGVAAAKARGIKVVVTDHHLPGDTLPNADAIVNPNQPNDPFPSKNLAGVGVVFYVMLALRRFLANENWFAAKKIVYPNMSQFLDLVALGTVADLVPLDHNNRILIQQGLKRIRAGLCIPAIPALLEMAGRDFKRVRASDLGFAVASRLNAAGRLDDMSLGIACLLEDCPTKTREIARTLDQLNNERRIIEKDMQKQALSALSNLSLKLQGELPRGICLFDTNWHQGVIGILAARIKDRFNRPAVVFAHGADGELKGSARSIAGLHIRDLIAAMQARMPDLIIKFGGHAMAAGLVIKQNQFLVFSELFNQFVQQNITEEELRHCLWSDGALKLNELTLDTAVMLRDAGPWGQAFPEPLFDDTFRILEQRIVGGKHLKMRLEKEKKHFDAISFFIDTDKWPNHHLHRVHAAYRLEINEYKGRQNIQLLIEYMEGIAV